ncbi:hypothetical protein QAD02_003753 [Eretmocerus hayati]|uniref:Uncharacterized protein n=1 Tax=Eretmocerus hayati TaxID=131215 RepID=A0ACC2NN22_9HYME|nr:hypothetical protein QAD02_003753 [Eretmocerus hayati]
MSGTREGNDDARNDDVFVTEKNSTLYLRQKELTQKITELKVLQDLRSASDVTINLKSGILKKETNSLDELHNEVWALQDENCEKVWQFSKKHEFAVILNSYRRPTDQILLCCECNLEQKSEERAVVAIENTGRRALLQEIKALEFELENNGYKSLKKDLIKAEKELKNVQKECPEIQRLMVDLDNSRKRVALLKLKINHNLINVTNECSVKCTLTSTTVKPCISYSRADSSIPEKRITDPENVDHTMIGSLVDSNLPSREDESMKKWASQAVDELYPNDLSCARNTPFMSNGCEEVQFNNTPSCEKIIAEAESNDEKFISKSPTVQPRKKFAFKTKSLITKRVKI